VLAFTLVVVGGVVRVSDSGLGCGPGGSGTHGWPLCGGRVVPLIDANMIVEYSHRVLAGSLAIVIGLLAFLARRRFPAGHAVRRVTLAAFGLVLLEAALGGLTVERGLKEELVAAHLGVAMLQLGLLISIAFLLVRREPGTGAASVRSSFHGASPAVRVLSVLTSLAVLATIVAGGYMSANELHGTGRNGRAVHMACGKDFPSCQGGFLPFGRSRDLDIHLTHRAFMYLASALMLMLFAVALQQRRRRAAEVDGGIWAATAGAFAIFLAQVSLGALNVWAGEHAWLVILHLTTGTVLWCSLVYLSLLALRGHARVAPAPREATIEAVPA
jgi:heme A synthase